MHNDIIKDVHEFENNGHTVKIVERKYKWDKESFLYFYVYDIVKQRESGGMHYVYFSDVTYDDLADLSIAVPKIKLCIDDMVSSRLRWEQEKAQKKKEINWTGQEFKRGDYVYFKGNDEYKPQNSYVWTHFGHMGLEFYLIQHKEGVDRSCFMAKPPFEDRDGFECVHSSQLKEGLKYIRVYCHREFQGETDELVLLPKTE